MRGWRRISSAIPTDARSDDTGPSSYRSTAASRPPLHPLPLIPPPSLHPHPTLPPPLPTSSHPPSSLPHPHRPPSDVFSKSALVRRASAAERLVFRATDLGADRAQFLLDRLVTAIEVVDAQDLGLVGGHQAREHQARRRPLESVAITDAPVSLPPPRTTATRPLIWISAPMRPSSGTCMNRFSKIISLMTDCLLREAHAITMNWACMSVGNPGCGWVVMSTGLSARRRP